MSLTEFQKARIRRHGHNVADVFDDDGVPIDVSGVHTHDLVSSITFLIDGGGSAITTGVKGSLPVPFACTITGWELLADQSGSIVVDIWKDARANYPPTIADVITASAKPTLSTQTNARSTTLTGWTTSIAAGDILRSPRRLPSPAELPVWYFLASSSLVS